MPVASKQKHLYDQIIHELHTKYQPGALLPSELAYAKYLGCGRSTLRKVLELLQEERKIQRTKNGTFVLDEASGCCPGMTQNDQPLYLLLPCAHYTEVIDPYSFDLTNRFITGCIRGALNAGRRLVTLPVSESNLDNSLECIDITWKQIAMLRANDIVLFLGRWYNRLIPFLEERQCIAGFISQKPDLAPWFQQSRSRYSGFIGYGNWAFIEPAVRLLADRGIRRVGCIWYSLDRAEIQPMAKRFRTLTGSLGLQGSISAIDFHAGSMEMSRILREMNRKNRFEAFIICPHLRRTPWSADSAGILEGQLLVTDPNGLQCGFAGFPDVIVGQDDLFSLSVQLVSGLLDERNFAAGTRLYPYSFVEQPAGKR